MGNHKLHCLFSASLTPPFLSFLLTQSYLHFGPHSEQSTTQHTNTHSASSAQSTQTPITTTLSFANIKPHPHSIHPTPSHHPTLIWSSTQIIPPCPTSTDTATPATATSPSTRAVADGTDTAAARHAATPAAAADGTTTTDDIATTPPTAIATTPSTGGTRSETDSTSCPCTRLAPFL
jgi:hypothetical protein